MKTLRYTEKFQCQSRPVCQWKLSTSPLIDLPHGFFLSVENVVISNSSQHFHSPSLLIQGCYGTVFPFRGKRGNRNFFIAFWLCDCNDKRPFSHWKSSLLMACLEELSLSFNLGLPLHFPFRRKRGERDFFIAFWLCDCNDNRPFLYRKVSGRLV